MLSFQHYRRAKLLFVNTKYKLRNRNIYSINTLTFRRNILAKMQKTQYFTEQNITTTAKAMYRRLDAQYNLHKDKLNLSKSALLVLDMQKFFHDEKSHAFVPSAKALIAPINSLARIFADNNRPVIITQHLNTLENANQMNYWWRDIITKESQFSKIIPEINILQDNVVIKTQYDAFYKTNLNKILQNNGIEQVIITGIMTHLCCETTARSAFVHGYNVFFPIDGTGTYNKDLHNATLTNLAHGFANITLIHKLIDSING